MLCNSNLALGTLLLLLPVTNAFTQQPELLGKHGLLNLESKAELIDRSPDDFTKGIPAAYKFLYREVEFNETEARKALPFTEIRLAKSSSLLFGRPFELVLSVDGSVTRFSKDQVSTGELSLKKYAELCWAIERLEILGDKRHGDPIPHDGQTTALQVKTRTGTKTVITDYGHPYKIEFTVLVSHLENLADVRDASDHWRIRWDSQQATRDNKAVNPSRR